MNLFGLTSACFCLAAISATPISAIPTPATPTPATPTPATPKKDIVGTAYAAGAFKTLLAAL
ncbi:MAG: hypothetical protein ACYTF5_12570, partial [Planctomycetota bacterium]